jgi:hypothetical protein
MTLTDCATGLPLDISNATVLRNINLKSLSNGTTLNKAATFVTDGTDGQLTTTLLEGDLTPYGVWEIQAHVTLTGGATYHSEVKKFTVNDNI